MVVRGKKKVVSSKGKTKEMQMKKKENIILICLLVFGMAGCEKKPTAIEVKSETVSSEVRAVTPPSVSGPKTVDPATTGTLSGKVTFEGTAPPPAKLSVSGNPECSVMHPGGQIDSEEMVVNDGALQNVFVYVKDGLWDYSFPAPTTPVVMKNQGCTYAPHVLGVQVGQPLDLLNVDPTLHNVHSFSANSRPWNVGLPFQNMKVTKKFDQPEVMVKLKCDVHPWMLGYVGVVANPYFAVTDREGKFELKNLPPGEYEIEAWHEKLGVLTQKVALTVNEKKQIQFQYS